MGIVDATVIQHDRPVSSHEWVLSNGKTAQQEYEELIHTYGIQIQPSAIKSL